jgi:hypothetical protein
MEPERSGPPDREPALRPAGQGGHQLRPRVADSSIRPGPRAPEGPLQLRVPHAAEGRRGAGLERELLDHIRQSLFYADKKSLAVEYSLRNTGAPIGVSEYLLTESLPDALKKSLPTVEQLEAELAEIDDAER